MPGALKRETAFQMPHVPEPPVPFSLPYKSERLRWAVTAIGWTTNEFARRMDMSEGSIRQMLAGKRFIPETLGIWVETLAQIHLSLPKPLGWFEKYRPPNEIGDDAA